MGEARKWPENEATVLKIGGLVASFPSHVGGARKWPENEATALKVCGLVALFPGCVGGARSGLRNWEVGWKRGYSHELPVKVVNLWYVLGRLPCKSNCSVKKM